MQNQHEFYFDKEKTKKDLIKNVLIFVLSVALSAYTNYYKNSVLFTQIAFNVIPILVLYGTLRVWVQYNFSEPGLIIGKSRIIFKKMNFFLRFTETEIKIDEIKSIGTDTRMKGNDVKSELLSLRMINSEKSTFDIKIFGLNHDDLYKIIKELNPETKLLNVGEFVYD